MWFLNSFLYQEGLSTKTGLQTCIINTVATLYWRFTGNIWRKSIIYTWFHCWCYCWGARLWCFKSSLERSTWRIFRSFSRRRLSWNAKPKFSSLEIPYHREFLNAPCDIKFELFWIFLILGIYWTYMNNIVWFKFQI